MKRAFLSLISSQDIYSLFNIGKIEPILFLIECRFMKLPLSDILYFLAKGLKSIAHCSCPLNFLFSYLFDFHFARVSFGSLAGLNHLANLALN